MAEVVDDRLQFDDLEREVLRRVLSADLILQDVDDANHAADLLNARDYLRSVVERDDG